MPINQDYGVGTRNNAFSVVEMDDGNFDYSEQVPVEVSQCRPRDSYIRPIGGVSNQKGPFNFTIPANPTRYIQLNNAGLEITVRVTKPGGEGLSLYADIVAPVNLLGAVMWENVDVSLNDKPFKGASSRQAGIKGYLEALLSTDTDARNTHLNALLCHLDTPAHFDNMSPAVETIKALFAQSIIAGETPDLIIDPILARDPNYPQLPGEHHDAYGINMPPLTRAAIGDLPEATVQEMELKKKRGRQYLYQQYCLDTLKNLVNPITADTLANTNRGFNQRYRVVAGSHALNMYAPITHDFFRLNNHVAPGNKIDITLTRYSDAFLLNTYFGESDYQLEILDLKLHIHTIERVERIFTPAIELYLMNETQLHKKVINANASSAHVSIHSGGVMPQCVIIAMSYTKAIDGDYGLNPFNLHHFHCTEMSLLIDGEKHPSQGLRFDFSSPNSAIAHAYHWMFANTGASDNDRGNIVSFPGFESGSFIVRLKHILLYFC